MSEFGCDNWRLENIIDNYPIFNCSKTDDDVHCVGMMPVKSGTTFNIAERTDACRKVKM